MPEPKDIAESLRIDSSAHKAKQIVFAMESEGVDVAAFFGYMNTLPESQCWRMAWIFSHYVERNPALNDDEQAVVWRKLKHCSHPGMQRDLWRTLSFVKISESLSGEVFDLSCRVIASVMYPIAARVHAMQCAHHIAQAWPELQHELHMVLAGVDTSESAGLRSRVKKLMGALTLVLAFAGTIKAQTPQYGSPLDIAPALSGNYGELRPNHFHAGVDLKTAGVENMEVRAVDTGYVSRIKVSPYGYGKALYIDHPDGYTTLYGHLNSYNKAITEYLRKAQYEQESFTVDILPGKGELPVAKGEVVALSGNTGGSAGPHVHFEIRETATEVPRNPLLFGFPISDTKPPVIEAIGISILNNSSSVLDSRGTQHFRVANQSVATAQPVKVSGIFGVELMAYDQQNGSENRNGIFRATLTVDGKHIGTFTADSIPFDQSRYLNALIDYGYYYSNNSRFMRLYRLPGNALANIRFAQNGYLNLSEGTHRITVVAEDVAGNKATVHFDVAVSPAKPSTAPTIEILPWNTHYLHESGDVKIFVPSGSIYNDEPLVLKETPPAQNALSATVDFMNASIPLHTPFSIALKTTQHKPGMLIAQLAPTGKVARVLETKSNGEWLEAEAKQFGRFAVVRDITAPNITPVNVSPARGALAFTIGDDMSGISNFRVSINERWVLAEYEPKKNLLFVAISELPASVGQQQLKVEVADGAGNVSTFEKIISGP